MTRTLYETPEFWQQHWWIWLSTMEQAAGLNSITMQNAAL